MERGNINVDPQGNQYCLNSFKKHWAKAQIDGPMQTIARYDDVAKLLITIGGFLLAVLAGAYSTMLKDRHDFIDVTQTKRISLVVFGSMLLFFVSAAAVCLPQPQRMAVRILELKGDEDLTGDVRAWCKNIGRVIFIKKLFLGGAVLFFIISFLFMVSLLLNLI